MNRFKLLLLFAMTLVLLQGCITYSIAVSPRQTSPVKKERFIKDFELIFNSNSNAELLETSAGKGNHIYTYTINNPLDVLLKSWFSQKFSSNEAERRNKIIITISDIGYSDMRRIEGTEFPWKHSIYLDLDIELKLEDNNYKESFSFNKTFLIRAGKQSLDIEDNLNAFLLEVITPIEEYVTRTLMFQQPSGYLAQNFENSDEGVKLKSKLLDSIDVLLENSLLSKTYLVRHSIKLVQFKNENYLTFKFSNDIIYNTRQSDKYKVAKIQFDDLIRKILPPLNSSVSDPSLFNGYNIVVTTHIQDFLNKAETLKEMEYRFLIPQDIAKKYKDKDITGQELINSSIILMNDERIKLDLN